MAADKSINVGIIGYGLSAKVFHIPFINHSPDFNLYGIVQRTPKAGDDASKDWPDAKIYRSTDDLFSDNAVDLVVISTAPISHYDLAKKAMEKGKNVLVEKPFVPTEREARSLVEIARGRGVVLTVYQNRRWDGDFVMVRGMLGRGGLGRVVEFETHFGT